MMKFVVSLVSRVSATPDLRETDNVPETVGDLWQISQCHDHCYLLMSSSKRSRHCAQPGSTQYWDICSWRVFLLQHNSLRCPSQPELICPAQLQQYVHQLNQHYLCSFVFPEIINWWQKRWSFAWHHKIIYDWSICHACPTIAHQCNSLACTKLHHGWCFRLDVSQFINKQRTTVPHVFCGRRTYGRCSRSWRLDPVLVSVIDISCLLLSWMGRLRVCFHPPV